MSQKSSRRIAFVSASTSGLGLASVHALASSGMRVAVTGRRGDLARNIASKIPGAIGLQVDLTKPDQLAAAVVHICETAGDIDVLVLNSGGPAPARALTMDRPALERAFELIVYPAQQLIRAVVPRMCERGWGRVIAVGSSGVEQPIAGLAASNAARSSLAALLKTLAGEVAGSGVTVNMVVPGRFATDRALALDASKGEHTGVSAADVARKSQALIPAGRYGDPEEFAAVVGFLASPGASYITGGLVRVDGGMISSLT